MYSETTMPSKVKAIFFDVGNTLLFPNRARIHAPLAARGLAPDAQQLRALERRIKNEFDALMTADGSHDHNFWWMYYTQLFTDLGLKDDTLRDDLVNTIRNSANWDQILPGTCDYLHEIATQYQIAVISNADGKIEEVLKRCEIAECFPSITDSGLVGYEKPHPEIFRQALKTLNVKPEESLYVGDMYSVDYLGATGAGMQAVLMDVPGAYIDKKVPRVESLAELTALLTNGKPSSSLGL
jgi:putative hydrolase of the HAD superfamily